MRHPIYLSALLLVAVICQSADAILIAEESFDYPNDTAAMNGLSGGTGWTTPWGDGDGDYATRLTNDDVSLSVNSFPFTPAGDRMLGDGAGEAIRNFNGGIDLSVDGQMLFASFMVAKQDGGTSGDTAEFILTTDGSNSTASRLRFGVGSDEAYFIGGSAVSSSGDGIFLTPGQEYFVVLKVSSNAGIGGADLLQIASYGPGDTVPLTEPIDWTLTDDSLTNLSNFVNSVRLATGTNSLGAEFDEIRVGYTWGGVTNPDFIPGDFDGDGLDADDFMVLRSNMFTGTTYVQGDIDLSGLTDIRDFILFREEWNAQGLGALPGLQIPEPTSIALLAVGGLVCSTVYRRRSRRCRG